MPLLSLPAVFMRGGTSRAVMFHARDLPDRAEWDPIFLAAMGSPDPNGRQLNGMGGGISSLSKVCVLAPSDRADADIDYTFAQVQIRDPRVDYRSNCGNMSSAVGPFAVDEGIVRPNGDTAVVRIFNTNTRKIIRSTFPLEDGRAADRRRPGDPGRCRHRCAGAAGFPGARAAPRRAAAADRPATDRLDVPGVGPIDVSMVDAANACVFVRARDLGLTRTRAARGAGARSAPCWSGCSRSGARPPSPWASRATTPRRAPIAAVPIIGFVAPPMDAPTLSGDPIAATQVDLTARFLSNGQPHRALPLTASLCTAVAANIAGTLVAEALAPGAGAQVRIGMPSGILTVGAEVGQDSAANGWRTAAPSTAPRGACSTAASTCPR